MKGSTEHSSYRNTADDESVTVSLDDLVLFN